jgi:hypothetical protein
MVKIPYNCDLWLADRRRYCDQGPARFIALSAAKPESWEYDNGASLSTFCCREHVDAEPRPTLAAAKRFYGQCGDDEFRGLIGALIECFPEPIEVPAEHGKPTYACRIIPPYCPNCGWATGGISFDSCPDCGGTSCSACGAELVPPTRPA